jgi:hypothetical protein
MTRLRYAMLLAAIAGAIALFMVVFPWGTLAQI